MARTTLATTNARIDSLESKIDMVIAGLGLSDPAKPVRKAPARKAPAKPAVVLTLGHDFVGDRVGTGTRKLTKGNRKAFIAAHAWAKPGTSTSALRNMVAAGSKVNKGWSVAI